MSTLYSWHDEQMVRLEREDLYQEIEQIRLLNDAGQTRPTWFIQQLSKFGNWLSNIGLSIQRSSSNPAPQYYQSTSFKFSP
jgi:hypothetical protein